MARRGYSLFTEACYLYLVYFSNINRAMQLSWSAHYQIDDLIKPFLFYPKNRINRTRKDFKKLSKKIDKELIGKSASYKRAYKESFKRGVKLGNLSWKAAAFLNEDIPLKSVFFNQSLVMFISAFETFMRDLFILLINLDKDLQRKILSSKKKISFLMMDKYRKGEISLGEIISENYNFQNIRSILDAYKWLLDVDLKQIIRFSSSNKNLLKTLKETLIKRHKIIHESHIYKNIDYKNIESIYWDFSLIGDHIEILIIELLARRK